MVSYLDLFERGDWRKGANCVAGLIALAQSKSRALCSTILLASSLTDTYLNIMVFYWIGILTSNDLFRFRALTPSIVVAKCDVALCAASTIFNFLSMGSRSDVQQYSTLYQYKVSSGSYSDSDFDAFRMDLAALPYHEPGIVTILIQASFLIVLNGINWVLDNAIYCGLVGQILIGVAWGSPGANWLSPEVQDTVMQLGYLGLIFIVYEGTYILELHDYT
jgi:hypothetical protein